jgi:hypothetical protein
VLALEIEGVVEDGRNTFVLLVTAIVMHCAVILICCRSGRREEYVCIVVTAIVMHCAVI